MAQQHIARGVETSKGYTALQCYRSKFSGTPRQLTNAYRVTYCGTDVVTFDRYAKKDGTMMIRVLLNTGGWHTATTKTRMNQTSNEFELGYHVYQKDFEWFISCENRIVKFLGNAMLVIIREYDRFMEGAEAVETY